MSLADSTPGEGSSTSADSLTVFHISDLQCGRPFVSEAADAMIRLAEEVRPDVVVCSGDLTQRAKMREFEMAREVLERFGDVPVVVTPGNHDVPLYRTLERLTRPYQNWRRFAGDDLDSVTRVEGATFVALNSAAPRRAVVAGRLRPRQIDFAQRAFETTAIHDHRIVVVHHHFVAVAGGHGGRPLAGAARLLRRFEDMGVSAILGGHVHQLHLHSSTTLTGRARAVPVLATGTTTSRRGRHHEAAANSLCVLRFAAAALKVTPYRRGEGGASFEPLEPRSFELGARSAVVRHQTSDEAAYA